MPNCYDFTGFQNYTIGFGARKELRALTWCYGDRYLIVHDRHMSDVLRDELAASIAAPRDAFSMKHDNALGRAAGLMDTLSAEEVPAGRCEFIGIPGGSCSYGNIERLAADIAEHAPEIVVAVGGSKCLDLVRGALHYAGRKRPTLVLMPTVPASNASSNGMSVIYEDNTGDMVDFWNLAVMPECAIVDTELMVAAPVRTLVSGIGDQIASSVEALHTLQATGLIEGCDPFCVAHHRVVLDVLAAYSIDAVASHAAGEVTPALEHVLHAITRYTGPELAVATSYFAHILDEALIGAFPAVAQRMHGEVVAFGVLSEMVAFGTPDEMYPWVDVYRKIGLPCTLAELGIPDVGYNEVLAACTAGADKIMASRAVVRWEPEQMAEAVMQAEKVVREYLDA